MHMRLAPRFALPRKGAVREMDADTESVQAAPQDTDLLTLRNGVG